VFFLDLLSHRRELDIATKGDHLSHFIGWGVGLNWPLWERTFFLSAHGRKKESLPVTKAEPGVQVAATETFLSRSHNASCMTGGPKNDRLSVMKA